MLGACEGAREAYATDVGSGDDSRASDESGYDDRGGHAGHVSCGPSRAKERWVGGRERGVPPMLLNTTTVLEEIGDRTSKRRSSRDDGAVKVGHDHDVELLGAVDELHRGVVDAASPRRVSVDVWKPPHTREEAHIMSLNLMPESLYSSATLRQVLRKSPSPSFMMLALCTQVTVCKSHHKK